LLKKPARIKDEAVLDKIRGKPCAVKDCNRPGVPAHFKTVGSGGPDSEENCPPLCYIHHSEEHTIGRITFRKKYNLPIPNIKGGRYYGS